MESFTLSKSIEEGDVVTLWGKKFVRCGGKNIPKGVWTNGGERQTLTLEGVFIKTIIPSGVVVKGRAVGRSG